MIQPRDWPNFGWWFGMGQGLAERHVNPAFAAKTSVDARMCNMKWVMVGVNSVQVLDWTPEVQTHHYNLMPCST